MRLARILLGTWLVFGGLTACSDHNPTVIFATDAATGGKIDVGTSQDGGGSHDGGAAAEVAVVADGGGSPVDVSAIRDLAQESNPVIDVANVPDVGADRAADVNQASDSPPAIDTVRLIDGAGPTGAGPTVDGAGPTAGPTIDGSGGTALDLGVDSSAAPDGGGTGG
jgi:hypothetical protein